MTGGKRPASMGKGWYFEPTILACPGPKISTAREELFGPVLSAFRFNSEDDAVIAANDTRYGLAAGIFTSDGARALRVIRRLRAGVV